MSAEQRKGDALEHVRIALKLVGALPSGLPRDAALQRLTEAQMWLGRCNTSLGVLD